MGNQIEHVEVILYVADQAAASRFYAAVLDASPILDVPGMTRFRLSEGAVLGLMPEAGIARIITPALPDPATAAGIPRCELYLHVPDVQVAYQRALDAGAVPVSQPADRDWGDHAGYVADFDGHVLAFAAPADNQ